MRLIRFISLTIILTLIVIGCGKKMNPVPRSSLIIPSPAKVELKIVDNGIEIINRSDNDTVYAERQDISGDVAGFYSRIALIKPNSSFTDTQVTKGKRYNYRFRNYYPEYKTYSSAIVQSISYNLPIELQDVKVEVVLNSLCVSSKMNADITYADIVINGKFIKKSYNEQITCLNLPSVAFIDLLLIPYNSEGISGVVYSESIKRDERELLLPPQGVKTLRSSNKIILSWEKGVDINEYQVYLIDGKDKRLIQRSSATIVNYNLSKSDDCVEFLIYSKRGDFLSEPLNISSCN